jgi:hypothetical protein
MTTVTSIITDAYREGNIIPMGTSPNSNQQTEGLGRLNTLVSSVIGNEVGDALDDINFGPPYDQSSLCSVFIPSNARLQLSLTSPLSLNLSPVPFEGQRVSIVDVANSLTTCPLTINGNGRQIDGVSSITINANGDNRTYMYRADIGGWVKLSTLAMADSLPFPSKFDDFFITMLAMRLNPRYGQTMASETTEALKRSRNQLRAHYHAWKEVQSDLDPRGMFNDNGATTNYNSSEFKTGRPYPWR